MEKIKTNREWIDRLLPEGFPVKSSMVITGPGGSGKPLIGEAFVTAWLKSGGSVIFMSLQYPRKDFITESLSRISHLNIDDYPGKAAFIQFDPEIKDMTEPNGNEFRANLVYPEIWDKAISTAEKMVPNEGPGILIFGSALNLLLFSPTYWKDIRQKIIDTISGEKRHTYIFSVSTTAKAEEIKAIENAADILIYSHSEKPPFRLFMKVVRADNVKFLGEEIQVPIPPEDLKEVKEVADHSRSRVIPAVSKI
jgi:KaiC/GvpD/RAD55 family RecA-like ATPase